MLSYIVSPDGTIVEPMIEDSSGNEAFEQAAVDNLVNWRYEPARLDGEPVAQSMTKTRVVFVMDDQEPGARRSFVRRFREIGELIENGELEQVDGMITDLRYSEKQNLYEDAWFWWLNYRYLDASGDGESDEALDSLRRALGYEEDYLDADVLVAAAERLFVLQVRALDISAALNTFERLTSAKTAKRSDYYDVSVERLQQTVNTIEQFITGPQMLKVTGSIGQHDYWVHDLLRRSFSLDEIDGEVEVVDLRCERGTVQYHSVAEGNTWTVPESWGECGVYIKGTEGTTFEFYELPGA